MKKNTELNNYKKIKNEISKQESNFKMLYSKKVEGIISEEEFLEQYNNYKEVTTELKEKLDRLEKSEKTFETRSDVEKLIIEFESCKKFDNAILKKLIEKIEIGKDQNVEVILKV